MAKAKAKKRNVAVTGQAHINASFNNIIISLTNLKGEVIGLLPVKWALEDLKRTLHMQLN